MVGQSYEDLRVWKEAMELAKDIYKVTRFFPKEELYGLVQQMRRSAVSIASNIAEGRGRNHNTKEFYQFLGIASGSLAELKTQTLIAKDVFSNIAESLEPILGRINEVAKMSNGLKKSIASQHLPSDEQLATSDV